MKYVTAREMRLESILLGTLERVSLLMSRKVGKWIYKRLQSTRTFTEQVPCRTGGTLSDVKSVHWQPLMLRAGNLEELHQAVLHNDDSAILRFGR